MKKNHGFAMLLPVRLLKILFMVKLVIFLLFVFSFQAIAVTGLSQNRISMNVRGSTVESIIKMIENKSDYRFVYDDRVQQITLKVNLYAKNATIDYVMEQLLAGSGLSYTKLSNNLVIVVGKAAQLNLADIPVKGKIIDEQGNPVPGVSIVEKGTSNGVSSGPDGAFYINVQNSDAVLVITSMGYQTQEIAVGSNTSLSVVLLVEQKEIETVVVTTALGIKKTEKALTYNIQELKNEELTRNKDANFLNSLTGKVAGVTINSSSAGIGGAARIVMRGLKSIAGNNNAYYVVDGIPIDNNDAGNISGIYASLTSTDAMSMLNPEDIESVSVLTGAAATALYGNKGQNGVVLITTKSGVKGKSQLSVSHSSNYYSPLIMPRFQNTYGPTEEGSYSSWGPKLATPSSYSPKNFFQTGDNNISSIIFSTGSEKNQTYLSGSFSKANGIIPNNTLKRYNAFVRNTSKFLNDKMMLDLGFLYMNQKNQNMYAQGLYHNPLVAVYLFPPGDDFEKYKTYERYDPGRRFPVQFWPFGGSDLRLENPYWLVNREIYVNETRKMQFNTQLKYDVLSWLSLTGRFRFENTGLLHTSKLYASSDQLYAGPGGAFNVGETTRHQVYGDLFANANKNFGNFNLSVIVGVTGQEYWDRSISGGGYIQEGGIPNFFDVDNKISGSGGGGNLLPLERSERSLLASGELSYKNMLFVNGSYRTDWTSLLGSAYQKPYISYPSVGASAVITDLLKIRSYALSFLKIRGAYAEVGNPPGYAQYLTGPQTFPVEPGAVIGAGTNTERKEVYPERTKSVEIGLNAKFLRNRFNFDVTLYNTNTVNQFFNAARDITGGGYSDFFINAGRVNNKGIEAALGYNGIIGSVKLTSNATFTFNKNKVLELYSFKDPVSGQTIVQNSLVTGGAGSYSNRVIVGQSLSGIYSTATLLRDEKGYVVLNPGVSVFDKSIIFIGNADPKYTIGFNNKVSYKNLWLSFVLFGRVGGVGVSATQALLDAYGVSEVTAKARDRGFVPLNGAQYTNVQNYYTNMGSGINGVLSYYAYDATNVRVRELSMGYTMSGKLFRNSIKSLSLSLVAGNPFMIYNNAPFDPESTSSTGTYYQGLDYFRQPSLKSIGFSLKADF